VGQKRKTAGLGQSGDIPGRSSYQSAWNVAVWRYPVG